MELNPLDSDIIARVDVLEKDRDHLYQGLGAFESLIDNATVRQKADRQLIMAIRTTQGEHGNTLQSLVDGQDRLEQSQRMLLDGQVRLEQEFAGMKKSQTSMAQDVSGLKTDVSSLKTDVSGLKTDVSSLKTDVSSLRNKFDHLEGRFDQLEGKFDRLELLVRKGFGMESEN